MQHEVIAAAVGGFLGGFVVTHWIALWAMNKAVNTMREAVEFREECLQAVREIAGERQ